MYLRCVIFIAFMFPLAHSIQGQSNAASSSDPSQIPQSLESDHSRPERPGHKVDLHSRALNLDGSKGSLEPLPTQDGVAPPPSPKPFRDYRELALHEALCHNNAFVVATLVESTAMLSKNGSFVYTKNSFKVDSVLDANPNSSVGSLVTVYTYGGKIQDQGEVLVSGYSNAPQYTLRRHYLLLLDHRPSDPPNVYRVSEEVNFPISGGRLTVNGPAFTLFTSGESLAEIAERIRQLEAKKMSCQ